MKKDPQNAQREQAAYGEFLKMADTMLHKKPGIGLGHDTWDPQAGLNAEQKRKYNEGLSAQERINMLKQIGVQDNDAMYALVDRMYSSPERAFMLARGGK